MQVVHAVPLPKLTHSAFAEFLEGLERKEIYDISEVGITLGKIVYCMSYLVFRSLKSYIAAGKK